MRQSLIASLLLLLGVGQASFAQTAPRPAASPPRGGVGEVRGLVLDSAAGQPLREASVTLLQARDSSYVTFGLTDGSGHYALRGVRPGQYLVLVNALGYKAVQRPVAITAAQPSAELPPLRPAAQAQHLGEVVVTHEQAPVSVRGDTVAFSARAFKTPPHAPVEQLLKKLPGVEVDRDGTIRAQGQRVDKVLVDGKPFFGGDPKMATRNLPASLIDQVQLYDQQSDQAAFSGIDSGERARTLNLVTRRDKRRGYFGTEQAGAGPAGRYQAKLGLNRFNNGRQISALSQADNANQQGFTDNADPSLGPAGGVGGNVGNLAGGGLSAGGGGLALAAPGGAVGTGGSGLPGGPTGITEAASGGLNYRDAWGSRLEVAGSYLATRATTRADQLAQRQNLTGDAPGAVPLTDQHAATRTRTASQRASLQLDYQVDSLTSLRLTPALSWQTTDQRRTETQQTTRAGHLLNQSANQYEAQARGLTGGGNALVMRKFRRVGRTFSANVNLSLNRQSGAALNQARSVFLAAGPAGSPAVINQRFEQATPTRQGALSLAYTEPLSLRHQLEGHYAYSDAPSRATRRTTDYDPATGDYDLANVLLSNDFASRYAAHRAGFIWQTRRLRYTYNLGLDAQQATLRLDNQTAATSLRRAYPALLPQATFSYAGAGSRALRLTYRTTLTAPAASQLQPVPDNSNPLSIRRGNPGLRPEYTHSLTATYSRYDPARGRSLLGLLAGTAVRHRIAAATTFDAAGVRTTQPVNADGYVQLSGYLALSQRLPTHQLNLNASTSANFSRGPSFINGQANVARTGRLTQTLSANSAYNERLELGLNANLTYQRAAYSLGPAANAASFIQTVSGDVYWRLPGRWVLTADGYFTNNSGLAAGYDQRLLRWNAGLAYQLFANRQGELKLYAFDLLGQNRSVARTATDTYLEDVRSQVLPRYLLLSFTYQLRSFGK